MAASWLVQLSVYTIGPIYDYKSGSVFTVINLELAKK